MDTKIDKKAMHKEYMKEYMRKKRAEDKDKTSKCEICGKEYAKGRSYEHNKTMFHQIADLKNQIRELKNIKNV